MKSRTLFAIFGFLMFSFLSVGVLSAQNNQNYPSGDYPIDESNLSEADKSSDKLTMKSNHPIPAEAEACLKGVLGNQFTNYKAGKYIEVTQDIMNSISACYQQVEQAQFAKYKEKEAEQAEKFAKNPALISCMKKVFGESKFNQLKSRQIQPTAADMKKAESCFSKYGKDLMPPAYKGNYEVNNDFVKCMKEKLGAANFAKMQSGEPITQRGRDAAMACSGNKAIPISAPAKIEMSPDLEACLRAAVGDARFTAISRGAEPTAQEFAKGIVCMGSKNGNKLTYNQVLPPPPQQVPFVEENKEVLEVEAAKTEDGKTLTLSGTGPTNALIDVYIFSDPKQHSVETDQNGKWILAVADLEEGEHTAYAVVSKSGQLVRSPAKKVSIDEKTVVPQTDSKATTDTTVSTDYSDLSKNAIKWVSAAAGILLAGFIAYFYYYHYYRSEETTVKRASARRKEEDENVKEED